MRKKVDERIRTLIENGVKTRHRSMFIIVGDNSRDQTANLHLILSRSLVTQMPKLLWCYKDDLELSSNKIKRAKQIKKLKQQGLLDPDKVDPFETTDITYCKYRDSERIRGDTFGMCILQDFEALTPNVLARTIETVEGGGLIIVFLRSLFSLTMLYTMVMDVHERFRTASHSQDSVRFNERFLLSTASCKSCIVVDDELNIKPISSHVKSIAPAPVREDSEGLSESERKLKSLKETLNDDFPAGPLIRKCCTMDQGKAVMTFLDAILDKNLRRTIALLASRGRGKSAALGLSIAGAVAAGYSNIFVTAPSPENLKTLFEFVCEGFHMLGYKVNFDYDVVKSSDRDLKKATVRINIYKQHRQTIQYIQPHEREKLSQVDLLVIDEAEAMPLPIVESLLGPYLVFLSSRSSKSKTSLSGCIYKEIELSEPIKYASADPIESWLNSLLCLDATNSDLSISRLPPPSDCRLYYVNKDTLFSCNEMSELFLQRLMAIYGSSHYKYSPNDLLLIADAPSHHLFVLIDPVYETKNQLPDILCVIQVCFEGQITHKSAMKSLTDGHLPSGGQIPGKFCEQFPDDTGFPSLSGARIVRIATNPNATRLGYGSAAVEKLARYFEGQLSPISESDIEENPENTQVGVIEAAEKAFLLGETIKPRTDLPPLLDQRRPQKLHYLGVSFGLTLDLFRFWRKNNFVPFYISHVPVKISKVTCEHTCMVLKPLRNDDIESSGSDPLGFLSPFYQGFRKKFTKHLSRTLRRMEYKLAMSILDPKLNFSGVDPTASSSNESLNSISEMLPSSMGQLRAYTKNRVDHHMTEEIAYDLACAYFWEKIPVTLSYMQASVLLCIGLQGKDIPYIEAEMKLKREQILSLYMEVMKNFYKYLSGVESKESCSTAPRLKNIPAMEPHPISVDEDLDDAAKQVEDKMHASADNTFDADLLQQYAIVGKEDEFENALQNGRRKVAAGGVISIKSNRSKAQMQGKGKQKENQKSEKMRNKHDSSSKTKRRKYS